MKHNSAVIKFRLNNTKVTMHYLGKDAFNGIPAEIRKGFDVYYERAFELFRADEGLYMQLVFEKLRHDGLVITDRGFNKPVLDKNNLEKIQNIPKEFGIYKNLTIYRKFAKF